MINNNKLELFELVYLTSSVFVFRPRYQLRKKLQASRNP